MRPTLAVLLLSSAAIAAAQVPDTVDPSQIPGYKRIAPGIVAAGQPTPQALPKLGAMGFKTVISLRTAAEDAPADEPTLVEGQGLRYVSVPFTAASVSLDHVAAVESVLADPAAGPVLLHCAASNRVGGVWAVIQARKGKSLEDALAAGREAGLRPGPMEDAVRRLLAALTSAAAPGAPPKP